MIDIPYCEFLFNVVITILLSLLVIMVFALVVVSVFAVLRFAIDTKDKIKKIKREEKSHVSGSDVSSDVA